MLSIKDLSFAYKKSSTILSHLDLELETGKIYGLLGLNGAGKTTLLNIMTGMLFPRSGQCLLDGIETQLRLPEVLQQVFIVSEQFELPKLSGHDYIKYQSPFYPKFNFAMMRDILSEFEVDPSKNIPELSLGQRKKFYIAFALATCAKYLILDEPTNGLDIPSKSQFRRTIAALDIDSRCILISTHQVRDLGSMLDHIIVLKDGSIVFNHSHEEISKHLSMQKLEEDTTTQYIYGEKTLGGIDAILPSSSRDSDQLDLELLFNGVIHINGVIHKTNEMNQQF